MKTPTVSFRLVYWDEETIRLKKVGVPFRAAKKADVYYDIPVEDVRKISFQKAAKVFDPGKTVVGGVALGYLVAIFLVFTVIGLAGAGG